MDPEFQTVLIRVVAIGLSIGVIGVVSLIFVFRMFAPERKAGSDRRAFFGIVAVLAFVMLCCIVLLLFSFPKRSSQMMPLPRNAAISRFV